MKEILEALREYIDKHFDYEYYSRRSDEESHMTSFIQERKEMEQAWAKVKDACNKHSSKKV